MRNILILFILLLLPLFANIDAQIEAIQKASANERFILMNNFKKEIVQMQEEERMHAITKLQSITQSKHADKAMRELRTHTKQRKDKEYRRIKIKHKEEEREHEGHNQEDLEQETEDSIEDEVENKTEDSIEDEMENETENSVEDEIEDHEENEHDDG